MKSIKFVGLDVHAETIAVAVAEQDGEVRSLGVIPNREESIRKLVKKLGPVEQLRFCYEAGPTGYVVYWQLTALGAKCEVVAPTLVPVKSGERVKTDRRDALKLARNYRAGELTAVWVPDAAHEALRDLVRAREAAKKDQLRAKHRLSKFLLRHGRRPASGVKAWTLNYLAWVKKEVHFEQPAQEATLLDYLHEVEHAEIIPPCSLGGVTLTIRKFNTRHFDMEDLIREGTLDRALSNHLEDYVLARRNILISGGTGTGKTTLLSILGKFIPPEDRILVIEDTAEIQLAQENLVRFEARREQNGLPAVAIRDLLKAALRHRPDRIVLGEIRGGEAFDLLQLLNTGHSGTLSTIHANSAQQGLARFTSCVLQSGVDLPYRAIKTNIADSLNVVVHVERRPGRRYISEVLLINSYDPDADLFDYGTVFLAKQDHA